MKSLSLRSYAKINLGLLLLDKRKDGYHNIATVFQQIDLYDIMTFRKGSSAIEITATDPAIPSNKKNLAFKAFQLFQKKLAIQEGLEIYIKKYIPVGGGLGGGSSNAATTLLAVNHLYGNPLSDTELNRIAAHLGSDVPFFLKGGTALGQGRGEMLTPLRWPTNYWIVLTCPPFGVSTSWAYNQAKITLTKDEKFTKFVLILERYNPHALKANFQNELEGVVFRRHPILREIKEQMYQRDAFYAGMSGSGSSIYGLFFEKKQAKSVKTFFSTQKGLSTYLCRPISPHPADEIRMHE
ncbi:4-(cytidine 5'-diphospho)-2-C-methyl-D-erythritol kinase [bacterium]|nr:4-(cytidine 5'-diphospho)-2-C-methyl-D-erythritol kinase [bacterium]